MKDIVHGTSAFSDFAERANKFIYDNETCKRYVETGLIHGIHIGSNQDSDGNKVNGHRFNGTDSTMASAIFFSKPDTDIPADMLRNDYEAQRSYVDTSVADSASAYAKAKLAELRAEGVKDSVAQKQVLDSMSTIGYFDANARKFKIQRVANDTKDALTGPLVGMQTPFWNISTINKVFKQPFLRGYAEQLVKTMGVPNIWADLVQIFTERFEGYARISSVKQGDGAFNSSVAAKNRVFTILSDIINIAIDYESPTPQESRILGQQGNVLGTQVMSDRDAYMNLMLQNMKNSLYYFGSDSFDGLMQIANRDSAYIDFTSLDGMSSYTGGLNALWASDMSSTSQRTGATVMKIFGHMVGDILSGLNFMPDKMRMAVAPDVYKILKFTLTSEEFYQQSPLSLMEKAFEYNNNRLVANIGMPKNGVDEAWTSFELVADPMLSINSPFNPNGGSSSGNGDVAFITFPEWKSALEPNGIQDVILAPVPIENMTLPSAPGYRDGIVRTMLTRVGSLIAPLSKSVYCIKGFGKRITS